MLIVKTSFWNTDAGATVLVGCVRVLVWLPTIGMPVVWQVSGTVTLKVSAAAGGAPALSATNVPRASATDAHAEINRFPMARLPPNDAPTRVRSLRGSSWQEQGRSVHAAPNLDCVSGR
jgi:hypothetical protein